MKKLIATLITDFGEACFDCGACRGGSFKDYGQLLDKRIKAKTALIAAIDALSNQGQTPVQK